MVIQIDLLRGERQGLRYFEDLYRVFFAIKKHFRVIGLAQNFTDITIWSGFPSISLEGTQLLHLPLLERSWEEVKEVIHDELKRQFKDNPTLNLYWSRLPRAPFISYKLEAELKVKLDDGEYYGIPLEIVSTGKMRSFQADILIRTYHYRGFDFPDIFYGNSKYQVENLQQLYRFFEAIKNTTQINVIVIGDTEETFKLIPLARRIYTRSTDKFIELLFASMKHLKAYRKNDDPQFLATINDELIYRVTKDIRPFDKKFIIEKILIHPNYKTQINEFYNLNKIKVISGSIDLYSITKDSLASPLETLLVNLGDALADVIPPRETFEKQLNNALNKINFVKHRKQVRRKPITNIMKKKIDSTQQGLDRYINDDR